jgi:predicted SAM-dependent methyltransferase
MEWPEVLTKDPIYLNLGGGSNCHPNIQYQNYVSVDNYPPQSNWAVTHDLKNQIPLPDGSVTRIHSEDFLEHITVDEIKILLVECYRLLKAGGMMRISVPDYNNPKDRPYLKKGSDPRYPEHVTLTNYQLLKDLIEESPFSRYEFHHYWIGESFIQEPIDYSLGMIKRTPDNDPLSRRIGLVQILKGYITDFAYKLSCGFRFSKQDFLTRKGRHLHVTSLVVDLFKD